MMLNYTCASLGSYLGKQEEKSNLDIRSRTYCVPVRQTVWQKATGDEQYRLHVQSAHVIRLARLDLANCQVETVFRQLLYIRQETDCVVARVDNIVQSPHMYVARLDLTNCQVELYLDSTAAIYQPRDRLCGRLADNILCMYNLLICM